PRRPSGDRLPAFVIPGGGGISVLGFRDFALRIADRRPIYGLEVPIKQVTEHLTVEARARDFVYEIRKVQPEGPYHLVGFSLGSWLAFEMTRQLEAEGEDVGFLAVVDTHCRPLHMRSRAQDAIVGLQRLRFVLDGFARRRLED